MKKITLILMFLFVAMAGYSQLTKADAQGFLQRNPYTKMKRILIESMPDPVSGARDNLVDWKVADVVSFTAMESGLSLVINYDDFDKEKFYPYASIRSIFIAGDNSFVISLRE